MIQRITRLLILLQIAIAAAVFGAAIEIWQVGVWPAAALGLGAVLLLRLLLTANNFLLAWRYRSRTPQAHRIGWLRACRMFFSEFRATLLASSWTMPFRPFARRIGGDPQAMPVLLVHGWGCNSGYWNSFSKRLAQAGISHRALDLEPAFGSIDNYARSIHDAAETLCREAGQQEIVIVAHSMGGLATRAYLRDHGAARIARVVTLGTPHQGTALANFGAGINCSEMAWTGTAGAGVPSAWLLRLDESEGRDLRELFVSIYSHHDNIIAPQTSSHLAGACNIEFSGIGHVALAAHPAVQGCVIDLIRGAPRRRQDAQDHLKDSAPDVDVARLG